MADQDLLIACNLSRLSESQCRLGWAVGLLFGLLLSLPSAIITKAYPPILILGGLGGLVIGGIIHGWSFSG